MDVNILKQNSNRQYTHMEIHPALMMGICALTVPFSDHSQSPRIVYQSGIVKQAMGLYSTNFLSRMDTSTHFLYYGHRPIVQTKAMQYSKFDETPAGTVCTVAIASYSGYNMEDSIILNRSAVQRGLFRSTMFKTYQETAKQYMENHTTKKTEVFTYPTFSATKGVRVSSGNDAYSKLKLYTNIGADGVPAPGEKFGHPGLLNFKQSSLKIQMQEMLEEQAIIAPDHDLEDLDLARSIRPDLCLCRRKGPASPAGQVFVDAYLDPGLSK